MKIIFFFTVLLLFGSFDLSAESLPRHCRDNDSHTDRLKALGPVIAVGASGSSGLMATPFPELVANQMCLSEGSGFESRYSIFFFGSKLSFLKKMYIEQRPKIVIAIDHLHHSSKGKRFDALTRDYIDRELARIALDCRHEIVDCSEGGDYHFVEEENYKPTVLLGDIFAFYAVDCTLEDPFRGANNRSSIDGRNKGCIQDYIKINQYMWQKASQIPNLHIMPVNDLFKRLHQGLPYRYNIDGKLGNFYKDELFWDGFHPWSEPGAQVMANIVLEKINALFSKDKPLVPYVSIKDQYFNSFTGIVLINNTTPDLPITNKLNFVSEKGENFIFDFDDVSSSFRDQYGDWGYLNTFEKQNDELVKRAGTNPLILDLGKQSNKGEIILSQAQLALIKSISNDPANRILGGVIINRH